MKEALRSSATSSYCSMCTAAGLILLLKELLCMFCEMAVRKNICASIFANTVSFAKFVR